VEDRLLTIGVFQTPAGHQKIECLHASKEERDMRIVVDLNRCQGYAQCVPLAPTVLKLNGEEALMYDPNPDDSLRQQVLRAAASCPVQAIIVDRLDEKGK
jgi:ferredoxin